MELEKMRDTCAQQEALLRFESFDNQTAWELGNLMVAELKRRDLKVCVAIWSTDRLRAVPVRGRGHHASTTRTG